MARTQAVAVALVVCLVGVDARAQEARPGSGWVVLPVDEYGALRARGRPATPAPPAAALTRIDYRLRADGEVVLGQARLTLETTGPGPVAVSLPGGLAVREARVEGRPAVVDAGPPAVLHLSGPGRTTVELDLAFVAADADDATHVTVPPVDAGMTRISLDVPGTTHVVRAAGGVVTGRTVEGDVTSWTVYGRPSTPLVLSWSRRRDDRRAAAPLRLAARIDTTATLHEALLAVRATVAIDIRQGLASEIALQVPPGLTVTDVRGPGVGDWRMDASTLRVALAEPASTSVQFDVRGDAPAPGTAIAIPLLRASAAERETGTATIDAGEEAEVVSAAATGLEAAESPDDGAPATAARAFRLPAQPGTAERRLDVTVARYAAAAVPVATIDEARYRLLAGAGGRMLVEARYVVRNNQRSALVLTLPPAARLWETRVNGRLLRAGRVAETQVLVPLETARASREPAVSLVSLVYLQPAPPWARGARITVSLPAVDLPVAASGLLVHHPPATRPVVERGAFRVSDDTDFFARDLAVPDARRAGPAPAVPADVLTLIAELRGGGPSRPLPARVDDAFEFPAVGPVVLLRADLTPEGVAPSLTLALRAR